MKVQDSTNAQQDSDTHVWTFLTLRGFRNGWNSQPQRCGARHEAIRPLIDAIARRSVSRDLATIITWLSQTFPKSRYKTAHFLPCSPFSDMAVYTGLDVISPDRKLFLEDLRAKCLLPLLTSDLIIPSHFPPRFAMIVTMNENIYLSLPSLFFVLGYGCIHRAWCDQRRS